MLFNSYVFIFAFLPVTLIVFYAFSGRNVRFAAAWLVLSSFVFYGWWNPLFITLLVVSIAGNYIAGLLLQSYESKPRLQTAILIGAITANLSLLFYYKYIGFALKQLGRLGIDINFDTSGILLPLGISFFTFTQIGYLIDCRSGMASGRRLLDYALFVTFFPHLIAGPILHHREMMPQFENPETYRFKLENLAVGLTIFVIGLAKKVVIADQLAPASNLGFANGSELGFFSAWSAALSYSMQLYFDFSGYSDMAIGLARMFGIRFPANFNSPYKATSIIDFWQRWHMTLTRYLTLYLYNPVALWVTRRRFAIGKPIGNQGAATLAGFTALIAFPTFFTMFLAGVWHGAGFTFVIFGMLHGIYLTVNHAWRTYRQRKQKPGDRAPPVWLVTAASVTLTYLAVLVAQVFFRANTVPEAVGLLASMTGLNGLSDTIPPEDVYRVASIQELLLSAAMGVKLLACFFIVLALPNCAELLSKWEPILGKIRSNVPDSLQWRPSYAWAAAIGLLASLAILLMTGATEFLYFQF